MFATAVARIVEQRGGRIGAAEGPVVADIDPQPADIGLALGEDRHVVSSPCNRSAART
ncbi:hypothetical protein X760_18055 [Mesorhizobium sp. LSHC422A00]|nr:hypothetical protein X760_18055 [Mesorhizobium sp. LSHC422A00]